MVSHVRLLPFCVWRTRASPLTRTFAVLPLTGWVSTRCALRCTCLRAPPLFAAYGSAPPIPALATRDAATARAAGQNIWTSSMDHATPLRDTYDLFAWILTARTCGTTARAVRWTRTQPALFPFRFLALPCCACSTRGDATFCMAVDILPLRAAPFAAFEFFAVPLTHTVYSIPYHTFLPSHTARACAPIASMAALWHLPPHCPACLSGSTLLCCLAAFVTACYVGYMRLAWVSGLVLPSAPCSMPMPVLPLPSCHCLSACLSPALPPSSLLPAIASVSCCAC